MSVRKIKTNKKKVLDMEPKRAAKGKRELAKAENEKKKQKEAMMTLHDDVEKFLMEKAKETGMEKMDVFDEVFKHGFAVVEFDETQGKASLVYNAWSSPVPAIAEKDRYSPKILAEFRRLRDNFPPIAAGVEWHRDFTSGGGFLVQVDNPKDKHQEESKIAIELMCQNVFQDQYTIGLDNILDIMMDMALTDGCAAAEIVYQKEVDFIEYIDKFEEVEMPETGKVANVMVPKDPQWKHKNDKTSDGLGGITKLKIIEGAASRLRPYRHPLSGEVLYWTLDEKGKTEATKQGWGTREVLDKQRKILKFHPWEILWLSWNQRGTNLKGMSIIQPVYTVARFVEEIQKAIGVGFRRWANKKYFFVCGTEKRPWSKPHIGQFLKALEKMIKNNWIGIPVPQGFKVEDMGGEESIFEGKNLLDYLTGMITAGMQYPREFLESGRTRTSEKAWLAWTVRYGRNQQQVRRAIEHQLWKRHLWCIFGKTYKIKKKGVKPENQEVKPTYVPSLQWRAEGRWHRERKTELLSGLLNVANPVDPPLKMAIQRGIGDTLGFGEIDWEVITKIFDMQSQIRLLEAKLEKMTAEAKLEIAQEDEDEFKEGLKRKQEMAAQAQPATPEQQLKQQAEKRQEGGVSRTTRGDEAKTPEKGKAKQQGGTRTPKIMETVSDDLGKQLLETEKLKQEALQLEAKKTKVEIEEIIKRTKEDVVKLTGKQKSKWLESMQETERIKQEKFKTEIELAKEHGAKRIMLSEDASKKIADSILESELMRKKSEEMKQKKLEGEIKQTEKVEVEETNRKVREERLSEETLKSEELRQNKLKAEKVLAEAETERLKNLTADVGLLPKEKADEITKQMLETEKLRQEHVKVETKKAQAEFERQQKKIKLLNELEERIKKKKKRQIKKKDRNT